MKTFSYSPAEANITAYPSRKTAIASGEPEFGTREEMDEVLRKTQANLAEIWNSIPGVTPVKKFTSRGIALTRIWKRIQNLEIIPDLPGEAEETADLAAETAHTPREGSKQGRVVDLLKRQQGATLDEIMGATGWQRHTVRGFIAGTVQKKLRLNIETFKNKQGQRIYRVTA